VAALWTALLLASGVCPQAAAGDPDLAAPLAKLQPALLKTAFARLAPQRRGVTDIYAIGVAGWSSQDVFLKELDGALASVAHVLPIGDRVLRLSNDPKSIRRIPAASRQNFAAAVHAVAQRMDRDEDVLLLFMTSHGAWGGFMLQMPGGAMILVTPREVAATLDREGIRNRVVIVSACYSGTFVQPLANDNTIVLTAADAWNTSFGCAPGRDWTFFGDALFKQSLQPGADFRTAFSRARVLIAGWERMDRLRPSNPQGFFGQALTTKLAPVFGSMPQAER
jgi:hypothetical protein